jgi:predicted MFS family arabinose efflux permease
MGQREIPERSQDSHQRVEMSRFLLILMSIASGVTVANLYYSQPLLEELARFFGVSPSMIGISAMLIQIGYALGLLLLVPLGDIREQRSLIMVMLGCSIFALLGISFASNVGWLMAGSLLVGITSIVPQLIVPLAAHLAKPEVKGKVIGSVMSGLLIGILLSRTFSGFIGSALGWSTVYRLAALMIALILGAFYLWLPRTAPESEMGYGQLLKSLGKLLRTQPVLREASLVGAMMFATFSAFWTTLSFLLKSPVYHLGAEVAGLFGLVGVAGAMAASVVGRVTDRRNPRFTLSIAIILSFLSYVCFWIFGFYIWGLVLGVILLDLGIQSGQISNQARIYMLDVSAHNRNNAVYMVSYFCGGALGSLLGPVCWWNFGWKGVCALGIIFQMIAATVHIVGAKNFKK